MYRRWVFFLVFLLAWSAAVEAQTAPKAVLVELFTSEGCSSCPPADALLQQVNGRVTSAGQLVVGISEHVTYWNNLGWADPFSSEDYTDRQNAYSQRFHLDSVYTPQMVIDGAEQIVGSDRAALLRAVQMEQGRLQPISLRIVSLRAAGSGLTIEFSVTGQVPPRGIDLMAVVADDSDRSSVLRGENSGRNLVHVAVARAIERVAVVRAAGEGTVQAPVPASSGTAQKRHLILFAQTPGYGRVLDADTKPL